MSAQDDRRDSGYRMQDSRRDSGYLMQDSRRAIGDRMIKDRAEIKKGISAARASTFKADLNALESSPRKQVALTNREAKGTRAATVGTGIYKAPATTGVTGVGIASPLTEGSYAAREFHPARYLSSSDGLFVWQFEPPKKIVMADANDEEVIQLFAVPT